MLALPLLVCMWRRMPRTLHAQHRPHISCLHTRRLTRTRRPAGHAVRSQQYPRELACSRLSCAANTHPSEGTRAHLLKGSVHGAVRPCVQLHGGVQVVPRVALDVAVADVVLLAGKAGLQALEQLAAG